MAARKKANQPPAKRVTKNLMVDISVAKFSHEKLAAAFNTWQLMAITNPDKFARDFEAAAEFAAQRARGETPTYGEACTMFLLKLLRDAE